MTSGTLRREDPGLLDALIQQGAEATIRSIPVRKHYASAVGVSRPRASRHRGGDEHSPSTRFLIQLATAGSAWPMISEGIAVVIQCSIRDQTEQALWARLCELDNVEHDLEAVETRATVMVATSPTAEQLEAAARANIAEAEAQIERGAILRELARRKRAR